MELSDRSDLERIIACLLQREDTNIKEKEQRVLFGIIYNYLPIELTYNEKYKYNHLPIVKIWTGR